MSGIDDFSSRGTVCLHITVIVCYTWYTMDVSFSPPARYSSRASLRRVYEVKLDWIGFKK